MQMPDFLNRDPERQVKQPVGGEGFAPSPLIGSWFAIVMHTFMSEENLKGYEGFNADSIRQLGDWYRYYFTDYQVAKHWTKELEQYNPNTVWVMQATTGNLLNLVEEQIEAYGDTVVYDHCRIATLRSKKYRHEEHMIALPSAVAAYADAKGWDNTGFQIGELLDPETAFTDDFQAYMTGSPDADADDQKEYEFALVTAESHFGSQAAEVVRRIVLKMEPNPDWDAEKVKVVAGVCQDIDNLPYLGSLMWERRAALWASLGESNPKAYRPFGTAETEKKKRNAKFDASSANHLSEALGILAYPWTGEIWAKVTPVLDPRVDAIWGDEGKRLSIACITKIYQGEAEAQAAAQADLAERAKQREGEGEGPAVKEAAQAPTHPTPVAPAPTPAPTPVVEGPALPPDWVGVEEGWHKAVRQMKTEYPGPKPVFKDQVERAEAAGTLYDRFACTAAQAVEWYDRV